MNPSRLVYKTSVPSRPFAGRKPSTDSLIRFTETETMDSSSGRDIALLSNASLVCKVFEFNASESQRGMDNKPDSMTEFRFGIDVERTVGVLKLM